MTHHTWFIVAAAVYTLVTLLLALTGTTTHWGFFALGVVALGGAIWQARRSRPSSR